MSGHEARKQEAREMVRQWLENLNCEDIASIINNIDGLSSAITINNQPAPKGKECEIPIKRVLDITFQDGRIEKKELIVRGTVDM